MESNFYNLITEYHSIRSHTLIDLALERGCDLEDLLQQTNISANLYHDRRLTVSLGDSAKLIQNAVRLFPDSDFATALGSRLNITSRGQLGMFLISHATMRDLVKSAHAYQDLLGYEHYLEIHHENSRLTFILSHSQNALYTQEFWRFVVELILATIKSTAELILQKSLPYQEIHLDCKEPTSDDSLKVMFDCPIFFNSENTKLVLDDACLDYPLVTANQALLTQGGRICSDLKEHLTCKKNIERRIFELVYNMEGDYPNSTEIACQLGLSERSLRRKLARENLTYRCILEDVKLARAKQLLTNQSLSVEYIAQYLGFNNASNFRRAFKRWTGDTPMNYRSILNP